MTIDEAKKAGFRVFGGTNATAIVWEVMRACCTFNYEKLVSNLGPDDFPTRAKARDELKRRKAEASAKRVEARVAARKAAGTQVPPPETPDQLDKAKSVESHETPVGETQPKEVATDETQDKAKAMKPVEHKLPDLPSWAPPLPEGYVPLGFGGTFKLVGKQFAGRISYPLSPRWDCGEALCGNSKASFYIAPRDSETVKLNFPWLAEGAKATPSSVTGPKDSRVGNKYHRAIHGVAGGSLVVDVYNVLDAFGVTCPACQHAIKKLLCAGLRNKGSRLQDLSEAVESASRAVTLEKQRS